MVSKAKMEAIRRRQKEVQTGRDFDAELSRYRYLNHTILEERGLMVFTPKEANKIIILDRPDSDSHWALKIHLHRGIGANYSDVLCPAYHDKGRTCPICQLRTKLKKQGSEDEVLKKLSSYNFRMLFYIIDMTDKDTKAQGVQIFPAAKTVEEGIFEQSEEEDGGVINVADSEHPYLVSFRMVEGSGGYSNYKGIKLTPLTNPIPSKYLKDLLPLEELLVNSSDEELENLVNEIDEGELEEEKDVDGAGEEDFEEEEEVEEKPSKTKKGSKSKAKDEEELDEDLEEEDGDEELEEEEEPEEELEEEEEPVKAKKGTKAKVKTKAKVEEEEEELEEEEEPEDEDRVDQAKKRLQQRAKAKQQSTKSNAAKRKVSAPAEDDDDLPF